MFFLVVFEQFNLRFAASMAEVESITRFAFGPLVPVPEDWWLCWIWVRTSAGVCDTYLLSLLSSSQAGCFGLGLGRALLCFRFRQTLLAAAWRWLSAMILSPENKRSIFFRFFAGVPSAAWS